MNQSLDTEEWPSIRFEGELLPQSISGVSILIDREFTERTGDWIWHLPHCKEVWKEGESDWCAASADEIIGHLLEHRDEVAAVIRDRLGPHGFDGDVTIDEWLTALARIQTLARASGDACRWIAGEPTERADEARRRLLAFLDRQTPKKLNMRIASATAVLVAAFAWGIWCGGDLSRFMGISLVGLTGVFGLLVISALILKTRMARFAMLIGTITAISMGVVLGSGDASSAFNECVSQGELVRKELARYKAQNGRYPDDLSELKMDLPGKRLLRGNILDYRRTDQGYHIQFQDRFITHVADESSEFHAQK